MNDQGFETCIVCGKEFVPEYTGQVHCSLQCIRKQRREEAVCIKTCPICGNKFTAVPASTKYCSQGCKRKAALTENQRNAIQERAKRANEYLGMMGSTYGKKCKLCGWCFPGQTATAKNPNGVIRNGGCAVHHIVPVREGGGDEPENLILLCPNCHAMADAGIYSREFLQMNALNKDELDQIRTSHIRRAMTGVTIP